MEPPGTGLHVRFSNAILISNDRQRALGKHLLLPFIARNQGLLDKFHAQLSQARRMRDCLIGRPATIGVHPKSRVRVSAQCLDNLDVLGCAQTGTGKTAAFAVPILNRLGSHNRKAPPHRPFVLALAPTRELAIQIDQSFSTYGSHLKLRQTVIYGGVNQTGQVRTLKRGAHILVATPGRLIDLMNQGHIHLDLLEVFVLDEADRMLDMGFLPDLKRIISQLPTRRQSLFFSATMPPNIIELSQSLLSNPVSVDVTPEQVSVEKIEQQVHFVDRSGKQELLREILQSPDVVRALVFTKTKRRANVVTKQ